VVAENWNGMRMGTHFRVVTRPEWTPPRAMRAEAGEPQPHL